MYVISQISILIIKYIKKVKKRCRNIHLKYVFYFLKPKFYLL